eukprot:jgi/Hompol1/1636/HPOL_005679-RA
MRLQFCVRSDYEATRRMIHPDGSLNQEQGATLQTESARVWKDTERALLIKGISMFGIGHFREISENLLPDWSPNDLRIKTIRLIGRQNLQLYRDWKGGEAEILAEYERNKAIGLRFGCWKGSVLVYDDQGEVLKAIICDDAINNENLRPDNTGERAIAKRQRSS